MNQRFIEHLRKQLGFIERSCDSFDAGYEDEAIRIATCIRVLMHDTTKSISLLMHLNAKSIRLLSTTELLLSPPLPFVFDGLTSFSVGGPGPKLGLGNTRNLLEVSDWWNQIVYIANQNILRRRDLVLAAANKDGGAHVDPKLTPEYEKIAEDFWIRIDPDDPPAAHPLTNIHLIGLRQLGYEVLNSKELLALL